MGVRTEQRRQELRTMINGTAIQEPVTLHGFVGDDGRTYSSVSPTDYRHRSGVTLVIYDTRAEYEENQPKAEMYYVWE